MRLRRKAQLAAIDAKNHQAYALLLSHMFRNELVSGMWGISQFEDAQMSGPLPGEFITWVDAFCYLTGRPIEDLAYNDFGARWGVQTSEGIVTVKDVTQGANSQNLVNLLETVGSISRKPVLVEIGSGYGGEIEKVARWFNKPARYILVDIPLNLTSAYAYIKSGFSDAKISLISDRAVLEKELQTTCTGNEFIFIPTILIESLRNVEIDILYNHGSFSEMNYATIKYYFDVLLRQGQVGIVFEINSNQKALNCSDHTEVPSSEFPFPDDYRLLMRNPVWLTSSGYRYLQSVWVKQGVVGIRAR